MNSALLLLAAAWGADAPAVSSEVMPAPAGHGCACCSNGERGGLLSWLRGPWMGWGKGSGGEPVKCDHPGPIPGSEHPTKCQMLKDRWCPCECKYSGRPKSAEIAEWPCKPTGRYYVTPEPDYGPHGPPARHVCSRDWSWLPFARCGKPKCSGYSNLHPCYNSPRGLWNRMFGRMGCGYGRGWEAAEEHAMPSDGGEVMPPATGMMAPRGEIIAMPKGQPKLQRVPDASVPGIMNGERLNRMPTPALAPAPMPSGVVPASPYNN